MEIRFFIDENEYLALIMCIHSKYNKEATVKDYFHGLVHQIVATTKLPEVDKKFDILNPQAQKISHLSTKTPTHRPPKHKK